MSKTDLNAWVEGRQRMKAMNDEYYMRLALTMAEACLGQTGINPVVGCVIVKNGRIIGLGSHLERGKEHAEIHALQMAGEEAEGSTVYVTLEPCSHYGRTPPCAQRLIEARVKRVVVACVDPNPKVSGAGIELLGDHGIEVHTGVLEVEALLLNEMYNHFIVRASPFVALKTASTLDGKIASSTGDSKWITDSPARKFVHKLRHQHQGIMVGSETVLADNPLLTTRSDVPALQPVRIIVDSQLRIPLDANVCRTDEARTIVLTTTMASPLQRSALERRGVEIVICGEGPKVDLRLGLRKLGEMEISSILLEGGGQLNGAMLEAGLIDKVYLFYAPKIVGGFQSPSNFAFAGSDLMSGAIRLHSVRYEILEPDFCVIGYPLYEGGEDICSQEL